MRLKVKDFENGEAVPFDNAFCVPDKENHAAPGKNISPHIQWEDSPLGTKSYALILVDPTVPAVPDNVNQEGKTVPKDTPRMDFYHLVLVDIPADVNEILPGDLSNEVTPRGKQPGKMKYGVQGINSYTDWFSGDKDMEGDYGGYDGPCPPWNDEMMHKYYFRLYALDVESLDLDGSFTAEDAYKAMEGHVIDETEYWGTYTMNQDLL